MQHSAGEAPYRAAHRSRATGWGTRCWLWFEAAWRDVRFLVLPSECLGCGAVDSVLCPDCARVLRRQGDHPYRAETAAEALLDVTGAAMLPVVAAGIYRDTLATAILAFKNHGRTELAPFLAPLLGRALAAALGSRPGVSRAGSRTGSGSGAGGGPASGAGPASGIGSRPPPGCGSGTPGTLVSSGAPVLLVPVPTSGAGYRRRGYDPLALLLRQSARRRLLPKGTRCRNVLRLRYRLPWARHHQKGLGRSARRANRRGSMHVRRGVSLAGTTVVIVDDVLTTGATLGEAARALRAGGARVRGAVVLAAARPTRPDASTTPENRGQAEIPDERVNIGPG